VKRRATWLLLPLLTLAGGCVCSAQQWEIAGAVGYGTYRNATIFAPEGTATAGVRNRFILGASLGQEMHEHVSGEIRYTYQDGDAFLASGATDTIMQGHSHAIHYDLLFHVRRRSRRIRPYVAAGFGAKQYVIRGPQDPSPPLNNIARMNANNVLKALVSLGGGLKLRLGRGVAVHFGFREYLTPFPNKL
jgi:hypothetical protein